MYKFVENWLNAVNKNQIELIRNNRKLLIFLGGGIEAAYVESELSRKSIKVDALLNDENDISHISQIKSTENFLIVLKIGIDDKLISKLHMAGMWPGTDYLYIYHDVSIKRCTEYYRDIWENEIIVAGELKNCNIRFKGWKSKVIIGINTQIAEGVEINVGSNSIVNIGDNVRISEGSVLRCEDNAILTIGDGCIFGESKVVSRNDVSIGVKSTFNDGLILICEENTNIKIGNNVLVSSNVHMRSGNGHSLFDISQKINISESNKHVIIGNHVWIGQDTTILFNCELLDDCVVGAKSLVKKRHEKGSLVYGVPAKTIRSNIGWDVRNHITFEKFVENEFWKGE